MGKFEIKKDKSGQFRFNLKASNGQVILSSEAYSTKAACNNGIASVRANSQDDGRYDRNTAKDGSPYFNLKASNGQVIGVSERYSSSSSMESGIASVKSNAPDASIEDNS
ncbi:YegP family protein [Maribacter sp. CXY002]|uniref:YegP family protein n=1 Tax=Maribacter luteocoastalis TaxID=3407671 RepID=UPI003B66D86A